MSDDTLFLVQGYETTQFLDANVIKFKQFSSSHAGYNTAPVLMNDSGKDLTTENTPAYVGVYIPEEYTTTCEDEDVELCNTMFGWYVFQRNTVINNVAEYSVPVAWPGGANNDDGYLSFYSVDVPLDVVYGCVFLNSYVGEEGSGGTNIWTEPSLGTIPSPIGSAWRFIFTTVCEPEFSCTSNVVDGDIFDNLSARIVPPRSPETHTVQLVDHEFEPSQVDAYPGDTIRWERVNGAHTVTDWDFEVQDCSNPTAALFDETINSSNPFFEYTIPTDATPQTISYMCRPHCKIGMVGSIEVLDTVRESKIIVTFDNETDTNTFLNELNQSTSTTTWDIDDNVEELEYVGDFKSSEEEVAGYFGRSNPNQVSFIFSDGIVPDQPGIATLDIFANSPVSGSFVPPMSATFSEVAGTITATMTVTTAGVYDRIEWDVDEVIPGGDGVAEMDDGEVDLVNWLPFLYASNGGTIEDQVCTECETSADDGSPLQHIDNQSMRNDTVVGRFITPFFTATDQAELQFEVLCHPYNGILLGSEDYIDTDIPKRHYNKIKKVVFYLNGGNGLVVTDETPSIAARRANQSGADPGVQVFAAKLPASYDVERISEVRAVVYPTCGIPRILQGMGLGTYVDIPHERRCDQRGCFVGKMRDYYVSPDGSDTTGAGTEENPYETCQKVFEEKGYSRTRVNAAAYDGSWDPTVDPWEAREDRRLPLSDCYARINGFQTPDGDSSSSWIENATMIPFITGAVIQWPVARIDNNSKILGSNIIDCEIYVSTKLWQNENDYDDDNKRSGGISLTTSRIDSSGAGTAGGLIQYHNCSGGVEYSNHLGADDGFDAFREMYNNGVWIENTGNTIMSGGGGPMQIFYYGCDFKYIAARGPTATVTTNSEMVGVKCYNPSVNNDVFNGGLVVNCWVKDCGMFIYPLGSIGAIDAEGNPLPPSSIEFGDHVGQDYTYDSQKIDEDLAKFYCNATYEVDFGDSPMVSYDSGFTAPNLGIWPDWCLAGARREPPTTTEDCPAGEDCCEAHEQTNSRVDCWPACSGVDARRVDIAWNTEDSNGVLVEYPFLDPMLQLGATERTPENIAEVARATAAPHFDIIQFTLCPSSFDDTLNAPSPQEGWGDTTIKNVVWHKLECVSHHSFYQGIFSGPSALNGVACWDIYMEGGGQSAASIQLGDRADCKDGTCSGVNTLQATNQHWGPKLVVKKWYIETGRWATHAIETEAPESSNIDGHRRCGYNPSSFIYAEDCFPLTREDMSDACSLCNTAHTGALYRGCGIADGAWPGCVGHDDCENYDYRTRRFDSNDPTTRPFWDLMPARSLAAGSDDTLAEMPVPNGMWVYVEYIDGTNSKSSQSRNPNYPAFPDPDGSVSSGWTGCNKNAIGPPDWINYDCDEVSETCDVIPFPKLPDGGG